MIPIKETLQDLFIEYNNGHISVEKMARVYDIKVDNLITLLELGDKFHEELVIQNNNLCKW